MARVKVLFMDVDGTLTDGKIYMGTNGELFKAFNIKDGYAIHDMLLAAGIIPVIITGRKSQIVEQRCQELGIEHIYQGCRDKRKKMLEIAEMLHLHICENGKIQGSAYIGDDILDIPGMEISEYVGCPSDAAAEVALLSSYVCKCKGGDGAVREFIEWLLKL